MFGRYDTWKTTEPEDRWEDKPMDYTRDDCGCYVDGVRGIYMIDEIASFARAHGMTIDHDPSDHEHVETCDESEFAGCEFAGEIEDEINDYMNAHFCPDGCYWGRSDRGDWGLWECEDYDPFDDAGDLDG